jgi:predicted naringenin-chalcone synthase
MELASWYLAMNPDERVLVVAAEVATPYNPPLPTGELLSLREVHGLAAEEHVKQAAAHASLQFIQSLLFGDGAVAFLLGAREGSVEVGPVHHLTNEAPSDVELLVIQEGGTAHPLTEGMPSYAMSAQVPERGTHYAVSTARATLSQAKGDAQAPCEGFFIHTGSYRIVQQVAAALGADTASPSVQLSLEVLRRYANLSGASVGFMIAEGLQPPALHGEVLTVSFGVGFSASTALLRFH